MINIEELKSYLEKIAEVETVQDRIQNEPDYIIDDYAGGNVDDAYYRGCADGEIILARSILKKLDS